MYYITTTNEAASLHINKVNSIREANRTEILAFAATTGIGDQLTAKLIIFK